MDEPRKRRAQVNAWCTRWCCLRKGKRMDEMGDGQRLDFIAQLMGQRPGIEHGADAA
jgi:hypothetical protein